MAVAKRKKKYRINSDVILELLAITVAQPTNPPDAHGATSMLLLLLHLHD